MKKAFAVRAVIIDDNNQIPILKVNGGEYYKIPGGTIEKGDSEEQALAREIREEAGCEAKVIRKIDEFEFYVKDKDKTYHSICYLAKLIKTTGNPEFDAWEKERNFELMWINIDEAINIFKSCNPTDPYEKIIHNRDLNFIIKSKKTNETN